MSFPRSSIARSSLLLCWPLLLVACSGDEFANAPASEQAGTSGSAGQVGAAGQPGLSGSSGQAGTTGGSGQAGTAGSSGQGGMAGGQAGLGGAGGATGGQGGQAGKAGAAGQGECTVGEFKCQGDNLLVCALKTKTFEVLETCNPGKCKADKGACVDDCKTNEVRCLNDQLQTCQMGSFKTKETCDKGLCSEAQKKCLSCEPGEIKACAESQLAQLACDDQGVPSKEISCPPDSKFCVGDGQCVQCRVESDCTPSAEDCRDAVCVNNSCDLAPVEAGKPAKTQVEGGCFTKLCDGGGGVTIENLEVGHPCSNANVGEGLCNGNGTCGVCKPGKWECDSGGTFHICNDQGQWNDPVYCPSNKPACEENQCIGVTRVAMGEHSACAIMSNGNVRCWGADSNGLLAQGKDTLIAPKPVRVPGLASIKNIVIGEYHACALDDQSQVYCWGNNTSGQVGTGSGEKVAFSPQLLPNKKFGKLVAGFNHTCATQGSILFCWGANASGQVSPQMPDSVPAPSAVLTVKDSINGGSYLVSDVFMLSAGSYHTCVVTNSKKVICWGLNDKNQVGFLGTGVPENKRVKDVLFKDQNPDTSQTLLSYGRTNVLVTKAFMELEVGGWGMFDGAIKSSPDFINAGPYTSSSVFSVSNEVRVSSNGDYLAVTGINTFGQLGTGIKQDGNSVTIAKHAIKGIAGSATNGRTVCAWEDNGRVLCWGDNTDGLTGTDSFDTNVLIPTEVKW